MSSGAAPRRLNKELTLLHVYAIATGATLSAGLFLLPGPAAHLAGPAVVLCYLLAVIPLVPAMLCAAELGTAMPRAGGVYYFLDRSLGPLAGTVGGLGTWLALMLKAAFALVGMGAYLGLFFPNADVPVGLAAAGFAVLFGLVNLLGGRKTGRTQLFLVTALLAILVWFVVRGLPEVSLSHFLEYDHEGDGTRGFLDAGSTAVVSTAGLVYISYVGVTKVASVSEEIENPDRNLPRGLFLSVGTILIVYLLCTTVMVGVLDVRDELATSLTPMADAAEKFMGHGGAVLLAIGAMLAFASVGNAAILASSRYPLAMSRDHLLPRAFRRLSGRNTPTVAIVVTVGIILVFLSLSPENIAKLASAFQLLMFALVCLAVIVMREARIESYDPGYRSPFYPWLQIVGIIAPLLFLTQMGWLAILFSTGLVLLGIAWYLYYGRHRVARHGAIYDVFGRLSQQRFYDLDRELRVILKEKGLRDEDPFDEVVARALVMECDRAHGFQGLVDEASTRLAPVVGGKPETLSRGFMEGTRTGATPVSRGVALPHLRMPDLKAPLLLMVRCRDGLDVDAAGPFGESRGPTIAHAIFFLVSPEGDPGQHLRLLAQLASRVDETEFLNDWLTAAAADDLREILLRHERYLSIQLAAGTRAEALVGQAIRDLDLPEGCLLAVIRRGPETIVPRGRTVLAEGDRIMVIGSEPAIRDLQKRFTEH